jgi:hypothetical protein
VKSSRLHCLTKQTPKSKSSYDGRSFGQSLLVSGQHLGPANNYSSPLNNLQTVSDLLILSALSDERSSK